MITNRHIVFPFILRIDLLLFVGYGVYKWTSSFFDGLLDLDKPSRLFAV